MKILISTPLFPPEINYPANFSKKFAKHLSICGFDVVVATFSDFPEKIDNVKIIHIKKNQNIILRIIKFYLLMFQNVPKQDLIILKQAGISSFITLLISKFFNVKTILKMKEDEVEVRIKNQKIKENSFIIWRVKKLQQFIFKNVDFILFSDEQVKKHILENYNLESVHIGVLEHPKDQKIISYGNTEDEKVKMLGDEENWKNYTEKFLIYAK